MSVRRENRLVERQNHRIQPHVIIALAIVLLVVLLTLFQLLQVRKLNHDVAMYLYAGRLILKGQIPFVDFVDMNPPAIMYINALPAAVSMATNISSVKSFYIVSWFYVVWSLLATKLALRSIDDRSKAEQNLIVLAMIMTSLVVYLQGGYGQRDFLFFLAAVPFLVLRSSSRHVAARWFPFTVGVVAGSTAVLKPWFIAILLGPEVFMLFKTRNVKRILRREVRGALVPVALYVLIFLALPGMRKEFFGRWVPLIRARYDSVYGIGGIPVRSIGASLRDFLRDPSFAVWTSFGVLLVSIGAIFLVSAVGMHAQPRALDSAFLLASGIAAVAVIEQEKGWSYHLFPLLGLILVSGAAVFGAVVRTITISVFQWGKFSRKAGASADRFLRAVAIVITISMVGAFAVIAVKDSGIIAEDRRGDNADQANQIAAFIRAHSSSSDSVVIVDTSVYPTFPAMLYSNRSSGSRFLWSFPIALLRDERSAVRRREYTDSLRNDVRVRQPKLVLINSGKGCQGCGGTNVRSFLKSSGGLSILEGYKQVPGPRGFSAWVRR